MVEIQNIETSTQLQVLAAQDVEHRNWERMLLILLGIHLIMGLFFSPIRIGADGRNLGWGWIVTSASVVVVAIAYAALGQPAFRDRDVIGPATKYVYLVIVLMAVSANAAVGYMPTFLWLFSYISVWMLIYQPLASPLIWTGVFVIVPFLVYWYMDGHKHSALFNLVPSVLWNIAISAGFGWFMVRQQRETQKYAMLLDQLQIAQDKLAESERAAGIAAERERVGAEIHDTLAQGFTSIVMQAQVAKAAIGRNDAAAQERLDLIEQVARDNLIEARGLVTAMAPAPLHTGGLSQAIQDTAARFATESGIPVTVTVPDDDVTCLTRASEVVLVRATQEALANIRRHSGAANAKITLTDACSKYLTLEITDNGCGIPDDAKIGYGLSGMRNRVESAGGSMEVLTNPNGTTIRIDIPKEG